MKFKIISFRENIQELDVLKKFLEWQNCTYEVKIDFQQAMKIALGTPTVIVYHKDELAAIGFFEFIEYFDKMGFRLL